MLLPSSGQLIICAGKMVTNIMEDQAGAESKPTPIPVNFDV